MGEQLRFGADTIVLISVTVGPHGLACVINEQTKFKSKISDKLSS